MEPKDLIDALIRGLSGPLPGSAAHERMRARPVSGALPSFRFASRPREGGVLILLYEEGGFLSYPLIKRPDYPGAHGGQISLPGGRAEPGESAETTALREAHEEIGVPPDSVVLLGRLSSFHVIPSNYVVSPVIATLDTLPALVPDPYEVERILTGKVEDLLEPTSLLEREIQLPTGYRLHAPCFEVQGETVWGATAMILNEFREVLLRGIRR